MNRRPVLLLTNFLPEIDVEKPRTLGWTSHRDVTPWNFGDYVQAYNVQGVEPPPPAWKRGCCRRERIYPFLTLFFALSRNVTAAPS